MNRSCDKACTIYVHLGVYVCASLCVWGCSVLSDSNVKVNVNWENSGGEQAVPGVRNYETEGYSLFLVPPRSK